MTNRGQKKRGKDSIAVDISKDNLDVRRLFSRVSRRFPNTQQGHQDFIAWVGPSLDCVIFEPTGAYHRAFESALAAAHLPMIKVTAFCFFFTLEKIL